MQLCGPVLMQNREVQGGRVYSDQHVNSDFKIPVLYFSSFSPLLLPSIPFPDGVGVGCGVWGGVCVGEGAMGGPPEKKYYLRDVWDHLAYVIRSGEVI